MRLRGRQQRRRVRANLVPAAGRPPTAGQRRLLPPALARGRFQRLPRQHQRRRSKQ